MAKYLRAISTRCMPEARNSFHLISRLSSVNFFVLLSVHFLIGISHAVTLKSSFLRMSTPLSRMAELGLNVKAFPEDNYEHILGFHDENYEPSKLQVICRKRMEDVNHSKEPLDVNGCGIDRSFYISEEDLARDIEDFDAEYGPPLNLMNRVKEVFPEMAIAAEFKRASPSKGDININVDIVKQCVEYAEAGAAVISVLTEFKHFKGTLADLKKVRLATQKHASSSSENKSRPAILRKDFILDSYQIYEARAAGADTVLLIVAVLGVQQLQHLIAVCRRLSMEPLVEVHTQQEMEIALDCGARVIGVNNRNLHTFQLNLETTAQAVAIAARRKLTWRPAGRDDPPPPLLIFALSGISSAEDVATFKDLGVACCLVGECVFSPYFLCTSIITWLLFKSLFRGGSHEV